MEVRDSSVGIATCYGDGRSEDRIPLRAKFSPPFQTGLGSNPVSYTMNTGSFKTTLSSQSLFFHINYVNSTGHSLLYRVAPVTDASHVLGAVQLKCDGTR